MLPRLRVPAASTLARGAPTDARWTTTTSPEPMLKKIIDRPLDFTLWRSDDGYILSVFVEHGVVAGELSILLDPDEADALLANTGLLERKAGAVRDSPGAFADGAVERTRFE